MKNNQPIAVLVAILFVTTAASAWLALRYTSMLRTKQRIEGQLANIQTEEGVVNAIASEAVDYSKKNPGINSILKEFNLPPGSTTPATGTRPSTR